MINLELITEENIDYAIRVQNEIFDEYNGKNNYISSVKNSKQSQFFLVYNKNKCIGVTGIYSYKDNIYRTESTILFFFGKNHV